MKKFYSNEKKEHFNVPKVIWSNGAGTYPIIDYDGKYGLTQFCYGIVDKKENLEKIKIALNNKKFIDLMEYVKYTENKYNYKIIALFKKDFYKYFYQVRSMPFSITSSAITSSSPAVASSPRISLIHGSPSSAAKKLIMFACVHIQLSLSFTTISKP